MRLALFAAFPQELKHLRKRFRSVKKIGGCPFPLFAAALRSCEIIAVQTGMGTANIEAAFTYVRQRYRPDVILSVGFCGALYREARVGDLVWASQCWHFRKGEMKLAGENAVMAASQPDFGRNEILEKLHGRIRIREGSFVTLSTWMPKLRLIGAIPRDIPAPVCDLETFHLAQWSRQYGLPFFAVRSVTDRADDDISPELFQVSDETGHYSLSRALGILLKRPSLISESVTLGRNAARASRNLCQAVNALLEIFSASETQSRQRQ